MARRETDAPVLYNIPAITALAWGRGAEVQFYSEGIQKYTEDE